MRPGNSRRAVTVAGAAEAYRRYVRRTMTAGTMWSLRPAMRSSGARVAFLKVDAAGAAAAHAGKRPLEEDAAGLGRDVRVVRGLLLGRRQAVDERVGELGRRPTHDLAPAAPGQDDRSERAEGGRLEGPDAARWCRVQGHARRAKPAVQEQLDDEPAERVADQGRRLVEGTDDLLVVGRELAHAKPQQRRWVGPDGLHGSVLARPGRRQALVAAGLEEADHRVPAPRRHPCTVDEDDPPAHRQMLLSAPQLKSLIKSGGGTGPVKPDNLPAATPARCQIRAGAPAR